MGPEVSAAVMGDPTSRTRVFFCIPKINDIVFKIIILSI